MTSWSQVSVVLITREAAAVLPDALRSIPPEAEVIVADADSRDETASIARENGARVVAQDLDAIDQAGGNFDVARNQAADHASRSWLLFLDADERLSPELAREIDCLDPATRHVAFRIPRVNLFWGRSVRLLGEDRQLRLVRKGRGRHDGRTLHQPLQVDGTIGEMHGRLIHENVRTWMDVVRRFRQYVPVESRALQPLPCRWTAFITPWRMFRFYYFTNRAWKDGPRGLLVSAIYAAYHGAITWNARKRRHA